jgi:uncharacterized protein YqjF (DUF2071 family)
MLMPGERPAFLADWTDVLFVHFAVDPDVLRPHVPFEVDTFRGRAYVSVVAFTQKRLRPRIGGRLAALASRPLADHTFLNVRTYVRHGAERGIYFLAEWIPNRLACAVGPRMYGLPYRLARSDYRCDAAVTRRRFTGCVAARAGRLTWCARLRPAARGRPARRGLERFLLERYTAYTRRGDTRLRFRVWHEPWVRTPARVALGDTALLRDAFPWLPIARPACAHFSDGVHDVWIGPPRRTDALTPSPGTPGEGGGELLRTLLPPAALLAAALATCGSLPPWAFMWAVCFALFFGCKWVTWRRADAGLRRDALRSIGYLFGWVGMDPPAFLDPSRRATRGRPSEWAEAIVKTVTGAAVLCAGVRLVPSGHVLTAGWLGMTGLVLLLHFGTFHLLSLAWRAAGVDAPAIMRSPARAASVADFWGRRWNIGFHELATAFVFRPLRRPLGAAGATLATFLASGLVHELVISVPARGGYGLPTAYFAVQGAAVLFERSAPGRGLGLGRGAMGHAFTAAAVVLPLPCLFHPAFVRNVVLPLLDVIGAA